MFLDLIKHVLLQKHSTKKCPLVWTQNNGSNCERRILAYQKNKLCLYIKNTLTRNVLSGFKAHACDDLSVF